jgi:hypothetical protein
VIIRFEHMEHMEQVNPILLSTFPFLVREASRKFERKNGRVKGGRERIKNTCSTRSIKATRSRRPGRSVESRLSVTNVVDLGKARKRKST